ncbi:membrane protein insertase YidC [Clostridium sp. LP20]|uniref:membrane protein insertase YidC n=1 Tax=Clostridium sp. LP20 TaxID=3418665 RepID=UPI003EE5F234
MMNVFAPITDFLRVIFNMLHDFVVGIGVTNVGASYVLAITLLTVLIRLCLLPFNIKSARSTQKMQEVQPEIKKIQEKYKSDPQKANMEVMKIYKEKKISMTGGCLPALLPLPILMALYYVFWDMPEIKGQGFLWLTDLGNPDPYFILPILSAIMTYIPSYLMTKANPTSSESGGMNMGPMNIGMSLMMGFMALNFPSILVIYWVLGGVIQLFTTYFVNYRPAMLKKKAAEAVEAEKEALRAPKFVMPNYEDGSSSNKKKKKKKK